MTQEDKPAETWTLEYRSHRLDGTIFTEPMFKRGGKWVPFEEVLAALVNDHAKAMLADEAYDIMSHHQQGHPLEITTEQWLARYQALTEAEGDVHA